MESTGIVLKKQSEICTNQERKFQKLGFEEIISKSTLYLVWNSGGSANPFLAR